MPDGTGRIVYRKPLSTVGPLVSLPVSSYLLIMEGADGCNVARRLVLK
ncbi:hypothetical protein [Hymenobacter algoricola]|uniref:T9SS type A sorting domain-containing protein n=1 Tax=Hymenobacter algoricola TaxID=486267 RepID=A0ABP7NNI2_9BACT